MIVIDQVRRAVFIHIPKTAGTSIKEALLAAADARVESPPQMLQVQQQRLTRFLPFAVRSVAMRAVQKTPLRYYITTSGHPSAAFLNMFKGYSTYWKCTFVRNPYDRIISSFNYSALTGCTESFEKYLEHAILHLQPQSNFITKAGKLLVDFVGKFETIEEDYVDLCDKLGLRTIELGKINQSKQFVCRDVLNREMKIRIAELYREDFELLGYSNELDRAE